MKYMSDDQESLPGPRPERGAHAATPRPRHRSPDPVAPPSLRLPPRQLALFLDVDGTLAPLVAKPHLTRVPLSTRRTLLALQDQGVALAALSGRPLTQVRRLLLPLEIPLGGSHGAQISLSGRCGIQFLGRLPENMVTMLQQGIERLPGVWLERKPAAIAVHWRQAPQHRSAVAALVAEALARAPGWLLVEGHCVHELRPAGRDKGRALRQLMRQPGFAGRWPLAIGDDRTDEDAFAAALALGGGAIRIGPAQETLAPWRLPDVSALAAWLRGQFRDKSRRAETGQ